MTKIEQITNLIDDEKKGALITSDISRRYVTGFKSSAGVVLITKEKSYLLIDFRYFHKAKKYVTDCEVILLENFREQLTDLLVKHSVTTLSVESDNVTLSQLADYKEKFSFITFDDSDFLSKTLNKMRVIKSSDEIQKIVTAQRIAEKAYNRLLQDIRPGISEKHVAALLDFYMSEFGSEGVSFDTIAASGENSASPHAVPTDRLLCDGDFLTLDFGAVYCGYHSDTTRTLAIGHADDHMKRLYSAVSSANMDAHAAAKAEVSGKLVDSVARATLSAWGYGEFFGHSLGHGVGLEIHENPVASPSSNMTLKEGMILTIEPGAYIPGKYGVRIEDMVVITKDGCLNLTNLSKALTII